jgi:hypothetical protein
MFKEIKRVLLFPRTLPNTAQYPDTTLGIRTDHHWVKIDVEL